MDRRQRKSREAIFQAFTDLLMTRSYSQITVQNIIDKADVGRSTFYAHFDTKEALLEEMCTELFHHVVKDHKEAEKTHDFSEGENSTGTIITHILYHLRDHHGNIIQILQGESGDLFLRYFKRYLKDVFADELRGKLKPLDVPYDFKIHFIVCSFVDMVNWWAQNGLKETPEELERYFSAVMATVM